MVSNKGPWRGCFSCFGSWPAVGKNKVLKCVSTFWLILVFFLADASRDIKVIEISNILSKFRGLPRQNHTQHQSLFFYLALDNDPLGLDLIYYLFLAGYLCPVSHKSCLPDVWFFVCVSSVPWNGSLCQCTLPVVSIWFPCCEHTLFSTCFGHKRLINVCREPYWDTLVPWTFLHCAFSPTFLLQMLFSGQWCASYPCMVFLGTLLPDTMIFSCLSPCWFPATLPAGMQ